jgi:hypothetical protein
MKQTCILFTKEDENQVVNIFLITLFTRLLVTRHLSLVNFFTHEKRL